MTEPSITALPYDDYIQSANTLFNFMQESEYLEFILKNKAIVPRYCIENIEYLNININGISFNEIAVLEKCFCDIPFHKLTDNFELNYVKEKYEALPDDEKSKLNKLDFTKNNTHTDYYGKFGIAFSKQWAENKNLQPVHYLNEKSSYTLELTNLLKSVLNEGDIPENYANDILNRLSFIKPLRGTMKRNDLLDIDIEVYKNFHDEKEWRYVPSSDILAELKKNCIIANLNMLEKSIIKNINNELMTEKFKKLWLEYNYDDIRYIIVPNSESRINIINTIMNISDEQFNNMQKYILISKILVLEEIRKDW